MKKRDIKVGMRVEIHRSLIYYGRTGTVRRCRRLLLLSTWVDVWGDDPNFLGERLIRVRPRSIRPLDPDSPNAWQSA